MNGWDLAAEAVNHHGAMQRITELAAAAEMVAAAGASRIAEIGVHVGGTLWLWRQLAAAVYGITLAPPNPAAVERHGASLLFADSHAPHALYWLRSCLAGNRLDVLFIDGDHSYGGAKADWETYGPLVRAGGLVLFHDVVNHRDAPGVARLWEELAAGPAECATITDPRRPLGFGIITVREDTWHSRTG